MARWVRGVLVLLACALAGVGSGRLLVAVRASAGPPELAHETANGLVQLAGIGPSNPIVLDVNGCAGSVACGYLAAKATRGQADLRGLIATGEQAAGDVQAYADMLTRYGFTGIPVVAAGSPEPSTPSPGSDLIVAEAKGASAEQPLLVLTAWPGTTVAAAYLTDPGIADSVVVAMSGAPADTEDATAEMVRGGFRTILADQPGGPHREAGARDRIERELPPGELRDALLGNQAISEGDIVGDAAFALYLHRPYTWRAVEERESGTLALTAFDLPEARNEWFATMSDSDLHGGRPLTPPPPPPEPEPEPSTQERFRANIDFGPAGESVADGYERDSGAVFDERGNGLSYGWDASVEADMRARDLVEDVRYDTLAHFQKDADRAWEIAVPEGTYDVRMVLGDAQHTDQLNHLEVEGELVEDTLRDHWDIVDVTVEVSDGRLTIRPAADAANAKITYIKVSQR